MTADVAISAAEFDLMRAKARRRFGYRPCFCCGEEDSNYEAWGIYVCTDCNDAECGSAGCAAPWPSKAGGKPS